MTGGRAWRAESRDLDEQTRADAPGLFIKLSSGHTHYEVAGPPDAPTIVLVHGFSVPYYIWDPTFHFLAATGFRVVRYDLLGRGYSDRPDVAYGIRLYLEQLAQLLEALRIEKADLFGLSMGGAIAAAFCVTNQERVGRLVLIDPSGARPIPLGFLYQLAVLPGISDALFHLVGNEFPFSTIARDFYDPEHVRLFRERYRTQMEFRGFRRAIISTVRSGMLGSFEQTYLRLGQLATDVLLIWGENDRTLPFVDSRRMRQLLPRAEFLPVGQSGHIPHFEKPEFVNPRLSAFLN